MIHRHRIGAAAMLLLAVICRANAGEAERPAAIALPMTIPALNPPPAQSPVVAEELPFSAVEPSALAAASRSTSVPVSARIHFGAPLTIGEPGRIEGTATTLLTADFDLDGHPDLVTGYSTRSGKGAIALAPGTAVGGKRSAPYFGATAGSIPIDVFPDFLVSGDFDGDGKLDLIAAGLGKPTLQFLAGNGRRGFAEPRSIDAGGPISALTAAELGRPDGRTDLVVVTSSRRGSQLRIFPGEKGGISAAPLRWNIEVPVGAVAAVPADSSQAAGLLVAAEDVLMRVSGAALLDGNSTGRPRQLPIDPEVRHLGAPITSIVTGRFGHEAGVSSVAALLEDGRLLQIGRPSKLASMAPDAAQNEQPLLPASAARTAHLLSAQIASGGGEQILALDPSEESLRVQFAEGDPAGTHSVRLPFRATAFLPFAPAGAGLSGLILAAPGRTVFLPSSPNYTFTVNSTLDTDDWFPADGLCADLNGVCTLRAAIEETNALGGPDAIEFNIGTGTPTITLGSGLPNITDQLEIRGDTGPATRIELNANGLGIFVMTLYPGSDGSVVRGLVINRTELCGPINCGIGIYITSANNVVQNCYIGPDSAGLGSVASLKGDCVWITGGGAGGNLIGGSTAADRNVLSNSNIHGIRIQGSPNNFVYGNYVGVDATGNAQLKNGAYGIYIRNGSTGNRAGNATSTPGLPPGNVVSQTDRGIIFYAADNNFAQGNLIGTNASGTAALGGNVNGGVNISGGSNNLIGGATAPYRNVISGNTYEGIYLTNDPAGPSNNNSIIGNYIGTNITGSAALGNGRYGIWATQYVSGPLITGNQIGGSTSSPGTGVGNVISGNSSAGMWLVRASVTGNTIAGNLIGLNAAGTAVVQNGGGGVNIASAPGNTIGGVTASLRNVIYGGIAMDSFNSGGVATGNLVQGNYIGTNPAGTAGLGYTGSGVSLSYGATANTIGGLTTVPGEPPGNLISGNGYNGVYFYGSGTSGNVIRGNLIGTNAAGTAAVANNNGGIYMAASSSANIVGGTAVGARNIISGNTGNGITDYYSPGNTVQGNYIGLNISGTSALPNTLISGTAGYGIFISSGTGSPASNFTIGGSGAGGNVISGNQNSGIYLNGPDTFGINIKGNLIGVAADGVTSRANAQSGVRIVGGAHDNFIGGTSGLTSGACTGDCNVIANQTGGAVALQGAGIINNAIIGNSMYSDFLTAIDLGFNGVTGNDGGDGDDGENHFQNFPIVNPPTFDGVNSTVTGTLNTNADATGLAIDVYSSPTAYFANWRNARFWVGRVTNLTADAFGIVSWNLVIPGPLGYLTATATDSAGNTSELSAIVGVDTDGDTVPDSLDCAPGSSTTWSRPSATGTLFVTNHPTSNFNWSAPSAPGGTLPVQYDLVRSDFASDFSGAIPVGSNLAVTNATDGGEVPASGAVYYYLVQAKNSCGSGP